MGSVDLSVHTRLYISNNPGPNTHTPQQITVSMRGGGRPGRQCSGGDNAPLQDNSYTMATHPAASRYCGPGESAPALSGLLCAGVLCPGLLSSAGGCCPVCAALTCFRCLAVCTLSLYAFADTSTYYTIPGPLCVLIHIRGKQASTS